MPSGRPAASCQAFATWRITATSALMSDTAATTDRRLSHAATTAGVTTAVRCGSQPQRSRELRSPDTVAAGYCDRQPQRRAGIVIAEHRSLGIAVARMWRRAAIPWSGITVIRHCDSQGICDGQGGDCQALSIRHRASSAGHRVPRTRRPGDQEVTSTPGGVWPRCPSCVPGRSRGTATAWSRDRVRLPRPAHPRSVPVGRAGDYSARTSRRVLQPRADATPSADHSPK
jgi:hypothetical protein